MPEGVAWDLLEEAQQRPLQERRFEHPVFWAAFYLTGV
jgi:CHAT domain-containing protein